MLLHAAMWNAVVSNTGRMPPGDTDTGVVNNNFRPGIEVDPGYGVCNNGEVRGGTSTRSFVQCVCATHAHHDGTACVAKRAPCVLAHLPHPPH